MNNEHALQQSPCPFGELPFVAGVVFKTDQPRAVEGKRIARLDLSALRRSEAVSDSSIRVSEALMAELQRAADVEQRSPEEVVEDAVERYLRLKRRERLYAYGECQAERVGIEEEDVLALVKETRRDTSARSQ